MLACKLKFAHNTQSLLIILIIMVADTFLKCLRERISIYFADISMYVYCVPDHTHTLTTLLPLLLCWRSSFIFYHIEKNSKTFKEEKIARSKFTCLYFLGSKLYFGVIRRPLRPPSSVILKEKISLKSALSSHIIAMSVYRSPARSHRVMVIMIWAEATTATHFLSRFLRK